MVKISIHVSIQRMKKRTQEDVVRAIQILYAELGRVPLKLELMNVISRHSIETNGGYDTLVRMAGYDPLTHYEARHKELRISNKELFQSNVRIEDQIEKHEPTEFQSPRIQSSMLIAGDTHYPFIHKPTQENFLEYNKLHQPKYIIQVGDLFDMYAHSKFPRSQNGYSPKDEERLGREMAESFFRRLRSDNPDAILYNLLGNHDVRPLKRTLESMPTMEHWVQRYLTELMTFEGVNLISDPREILRIDGVGFHHGYLGQFGAHRDASLENIVVGHTHRGGVSYRRVRNQTLWELNAGFMGDPEAKVFSYTPSKIQDYTLGFGYIDNYGPRFIHR